MSGEASGYQELAQDEDKKRLSPAFLSPRLWDPEDGDELPPSSEVPKQPTVVGRKNQDTACFGLFCFIMALFLTQGLSAILSANYQLPHDFEKCEKRVIENSMPVARIIPQEEIEKYKEDQAAQARHRKSPVLENNRGGAAKPLTPSRASRALLGLSMATRAQDSESAILEKSRGGAPQQPLMQSRVSRALLDLSMASLKEVITGLLESPVLDVIGNETMAMANFSAEQIEENITSSEGVLNRIATPIEQAALNATGTELDAALVRLWSICYQSWNIICLLAIGSIMAGMFWVWLLEDFTYPVLLLTVGLLPLTLFVSALWVFFSGYSAAFYIPLFVTFALSLVILAYLSEKLKFSSAIIGCARSVKRLYSSRRALSESMWERGEIIRHTRL